MLSKISTTESCNGTSKITFCCLLKHRVLHYAPNKASQIMKAVVVLQNVCIRNGLELINEENVNINDSGYLNVPNIEDIIDRVNPEPSA